MAGIEQLEVHSRSYIVRWVKVEEGFSISWSLQPHKKSLNFGIVKHPGSGGTNLTANAIADLDSTTETSVPETKSRPFSKKDASTAQDQLSSKGFIPLKWHGKCEADKVSMGVYDVAQGQGGMFGLVFDNTFSKQTGKTATFVLLIYPTGAPPQTMHHLPHLGTSASASASNTSLGRHGNTNANPAASVDSLHSRLATGGQGQRTASVSGRSDHAGATSTYHVGNLMKRRRKKGQGYARRFFSLDYSSCTLSYYHSRGSSALRGAIPLSLAAIAADQVRREITIDSGAEVWHLKASNAKEFTDWARALERASRIARGLEAAPEPAASIPRLKIDTVQALKAPAKVDLEGEKEWQQVETLVSRIVGTRDALRRVVKDIAAQSQQNSTHPPQSPPPPVTPNAESGDGQLAPVEKRSFWKRKPSSTSLAATAAAQAAQSAIAVPAPGITTTISSNGSKQEKRKSRAGAGGGSRQEASTEEHCQALLADLDSVLAEFTSLIAKSKRRRIPEHPHSPALSRKSVESTSTTDEFFDAEPGESSSRIVKIQRSEEDEVEDEDEDYASVNSSSGSSSISEEEGAGGTSDQLFPAKPKSLSPLPINGTVTRRKTVPPAAALPPSLISFFRKNVGKDLSTISMPVSANEPLSLLQKVAEQLEYAQLLNQAAKQKAEKDRMLYVAAFALSQFSSARARERAIRKPFNPLLGETYELVRSDAEVPGGFRLLVEKVSHRPVRLAMHADAATWSLTQAPAPSQKFWGKSAEITTEGRVRVALRLEGGADEFYSWNIATMFLRNVVVGEKYVEPVGNMTVMNDSTGAKAVVEFRSKGMFGGRGEDVQVETFDSGGTQTGESLTGTWTGSLKVTGGSAGSKGREIWRAGGMAENAAQAYGFTSFAASLNEITEVEKGKLPPSDSRLRPDQRLAEEGKLDDAEEWKVRLEEAQRARRRDVEERGDVHRPRWFTKVAEGPEGDQVWRLKGGKDGYWEERSRGTWGGVEKIFDA
ncbi:related to OSBP-related protein 7 [Cephalotrichum gorgonifer]|uniref:Related to OSBP-related protein 7 n=1 Tax=Cephalotrichum gorgonifer TaxID=2041049 RepID=A0AAE8N7D5_9PEZI|nr:related to OSBP-related protein 7 [Cephalotrichum gorgonifer]